MFGMICMNLLKSGTAKGQEKGRNPTPHTLCISVLGDVFTSKWFYAVSYIKHNEQMFLNGIHTYTQYIKKN